MKTQFSFNCHSFIDVITNSSSEIFMTTEKKVVEFFQELLSKKPCKSIEIFTYDEFAKKYDFDELKEENPQYFQETYGHISKDDMILTLEYNSDDYDFVFNFADLLDMKPIWE